MHHMLVMKSELIDTNHHDLAAQIESLMMAQLELQTALLRFEEQI